jgi:hypothetical protein
LEIENPCSKHEKENAEMTTYPEMTEFVAERKKRLESDVEACKANPSSGSLMGPLEVAHRLLGEHGDLLYADGQWYEWVEEAPGYFSCSELDADRIALGAMIRTLVAEKHAEHHFTPDGVRMVRHSIRMYLAVPDHLLPLPNGIEPSVTE